jgi:hypothetical protein
VNSDIGRVLRPIHELDRPRRLKGRRALEPRVADLLQRVLRGVLARVGEAVPVLWQRVIADPPAIEKPTPTTPSPPELE